MLTQYLHYFIHSPLCSLMSCRLLLTGENWNPDLRAPLSSPGVNVHEGDFLIAINGVPLIPPNSPEAAIEGFADKQVTISINTVPSAQGAHNVKLIPVKSEGVLRSRSWAEDNRRLVDKLPGGTLGYVWLPNTAEESYTYFNRYYFGQQDKHGAVLDERFNGDGDIADYIIDIVARKQRFTKHNITVHQLKGGHRHTDITPVLEKTDERADSLVAM
jgi:tricorn protease